MVDLINGDLTVEDVVDPNYIREEVLSRRPLLTDGERERLTDVPLQDAVDTLLSHAHLETLDSVKAGDLPAAVPGHHERELKKLGGSDIEARLMDSEWLRALAPRHGLDPQGQFNSDQFATLSPLQSPQTAALARRQKQQRLAEQNNLWLRDYTDPAVIGLALELADEGLDGEELYQFLRESIYRAVMLHEVGHTVGLRHNFGGSADALNYHPEYWAQRTATLRVPQTVGDLLLMNCAELNDENIDGCAEQVLGRMSEFQYSSIMDYGAKFNSDFHGLGSYDRAALASAYGNLREVFDSDATDDLPTGFDGLLSAVADLPSPLFGTLYDSIHYTDLPALFGSVEALGDRSWVPREDVETNPTDYVLVPYVACYDEYVDAAELCHRWDQGADAFEITTNWIRAYQDYYVFNSLSRDTIGFSPFDTFERVTLRYFLPIQNMYQHGLFSLSFSADPVISSYQSLQMTAGFNQLARVLTTPRYGSYIFDGTAYRWVSYRRGDGEIYIPPGAGRREFSRYDTSAGYNAPQRVAEAGYYWDQIGALLALTSNDASLLGVGRDIAADLLNYSIPYYLLYQPQLDALFADLFLEQTLPIGPYVADGFISQRGLFTLDPAASRPLNAIPVDVSVPWSTRIRSVIFAMADFKVNFDLSFLQGGQVALEGSGEVLTPIASYEVVQYSDPLSGRVYNAYWDPAATEQRFLAADLMTTLTPLADQYALLADGPEKDQLRRVLRDGAENLEILRALYKTFEYSL